MLHKEKQKERVCRFWNVAREWSIGGVNTSLWSMESVSRQSISQKAIRSEASV